MNMEHNKLTSIAYARPIIYAEGLFASCYLDQGEFIPEEGISQTDLWSILSGELFNSGSDLVEDYALNLKLRRLRSISSNTYELDQFPNDVFCSSCSKEDIIEKENIDEDRQRIKSIPIMQIRTSMDKEETSFMGEETCNELKLRKRYEQQVSWIMGEEGEEFVSMETFPRFTDALILLDVLKQFNVPSVVSFLARSDEPIALTYSKTKIGLDCLMFCLFQA